MGRRGDVARATSPTTGCGASRGSASANAQQLRVLRGKENAIITKLPQAMVMRDLPAERARPTFILARGSYDAPTDRVEADTPAMLPRFDGPKNRLGLARWLVAPNNPLAARVVVNRYWGLLFGTGLVATPEDFGNQGRLPTHPALLDYLAVTLARRRLEPEGRCCARSCCRRPTGSRRPRPPRRSRSTPPTRSWRAGRPIGWPPSRSATARWPPAACSCAPSAARASIPTSRPACGKSWPRATRRRTRRARATTCIAAACTRCGSAARRRPRRSASTPSERLLCIVKRQRTSTPLQALVLLNDVQYVEAARVLAERLLREGGDTPEARITTAYRLLTSRAPRPTELAAVRALFEKERATFAGDVPRGQGAGEGRRGAAGAGAGPGGRRGVDGGREHDHEHGRSGEQAMKALEDLKFNATRRHFLSAASLGIGSVALGALLDPARLFGGSAQAPVATVPGATPTGPICRPRTWCRAPSA